MQIIKLLSDYARDEFLNFSDIKCFTLDLVVSSIVRTPHLIRPRSLQFLSYT